MKPAQILLSLISLPGVGKKTAQNFYSSLTDKTEDENTLLDQIRIYRDEGNKFPDVSKSMITLAFSKTESLVEKSSSLDHQIISIFDDNYPSRLKTIENPPVVIFVKGNFLFERQKTCFEATFFKAVFKASKGKLVAVKIVFF